MKFARWRILTRRHGQVVFIIFLVDFRQFLEKSKKRYDPILVKIAVIWAKIAYFSPCFSAKIFNKYNIGPWSY
jgi:hypothetical protein